MATIPVSVEENFGAGDDGGKGQFIRVIVADTQAIFRAGLRKDLRAGRRHSRGGPGRDAGADSVRGREIFRRRSDLRSCADSESGGSGVRLAAPESAAASGRGHTGPDEELTLELFRRGAHGIVSREVEPELLVECLRKVVAGETWLDPQGVHWVMEAYPQPEQPADGIASEGAADSQGNTDRFVRDPGNEEQRDCVARGHDRTGREELSAQGVRQARSGGPPGTGAVLPESSRGRQYESARVAHA